MKWSRTRTLVAGLTLILATNAVALVGVTYNRSGEPESTLTLTQRELYLPYGWGFSRENTGISLMLKWRVLAGRNDTRQTGRKYTAYGNAPDWLDRAKLADLGFDLPEAGDSPRARRRYDRLLPKEALLVLELDGPAYQAALEDARNHLKQEETLLAENAGRKEFEVRVKNAQRELHQEEHMHSRLFVIDAGLDAASLRARYPDRTRYAIVRGQIQPFRATGNRSSSGYVAGLNVTRINVPAEYRRIFASLQEGPRVNEYGVAANPYEVSVAYGKRFEPWVTEAKKVR